jgi:ABC-2 type transport system ATP-binding protein
MPKPVCLVTNVTKSFGLHKALDNINLVLMEREIYGLLGSNGAGKSTLIKIVTGIMMQDLGNVQYFGQELDKNYSKIKTLFSVVPQDISCYHGFSVYHNLRFFGLMYGLKGEKLDEKIEYLLDWFQLKEFEKKTVADLSGGYKRLVNIACSLLHDPQIIFLDEPTVGLDPTMRRLIWKKIKELKNQGKTICLTTHYLDEAQQLCDRVGLLVNGKLLVSGTPNELIEKFGGVRILIMKLDKIIDEAHAELIKNSFPDSRVEITGSVIVISFSQEHSLEKISILTQWLNDQGYEVASSVIKEPELEDVFLNVTGERLRN